MKTYKIEGVVSQGYEPVRDQFEKNFMDGLESCAQLCVYVGEEKVVDLWGSMIGSKQYDGDTITCIFSSVKSLTSICFAILVDKNLLDYGDKVIKHWPEFANGDKEKEAITIRDVLVHESGLANIPTLKLVDIQRENIKKNAIGRIIENEPLRFPSSNNNSKAEYHMFSRGLILNEIFRRVDPQHRTIGECLRDEISTPLNAECDIGLELEKLDKSYEMSFLSLRQVICACLIPKFLGRPVIPSALDLFYAWANMPIAVPPFELFPLNDANGAIRYFEISSVRMGELPSNNGQCSARGLAKVGAIMVNAGKIDGKVILSKETCEKFHRVCEESKIFNPSGTKVKFCQGGVNNYAADDDNCTLSENDKLSLRNRAGYIGWKGVGGSVFQWHLDYKISFAYVPTFLAWEDFSNSRAALFQKIVLDCATLLRKT